MISKQSLSFKNWKHLFFMRYRFSFYYPPFNQIDMIEQQLHKIFQWNHQCKVLVVNDGQLGHLFFQSCIKCSGLVNVTQRSFGFPLFFAFAPLKLLLFPVPASAPSSQIPSFLSFATPAGCCICPWKHKQHQYICVRCPTAGYSRSEFPDWLQRVEFG